MRRCATQRHALDTRLVYIRTHALFSPKKEKSRSSLRPGAAQRSAAASGPVSRGKIPNV